MRHPLSILLLLCCCLPLWSQSQIVSGVVSGPDGVIAKVSVREIDKNQRFFNSTKTDRNGLFSFKVRDIEHSLQFYAPGYRTITHKMFGEKVIRVKMDKRRISPSVKKAKVVLKSDRLFNGHYLGEVVRQYAWIERLNDTLFAIILPIEMERTVDEYAAGRQLIILDDYDHMVMQLENVVDAYPVRGNPADVDQSNIVQTYIGLEHGDDATYVPGASESTDRLYAYPHFEISRAQLERLCNEPSLLSRLAVDNYRGNNYWNLFPTPQTIELIQKALTKKVKR